MTRYLCVIWELDPDSFLRFQALSREAAMGAEEDSAFHPHITLACYEEIDDELLFPYARDFAAATAPFPVRFEEVGLLTQDIAACFPAFTGPLREHYMSWHLQYSTQADRWTSPSGGLYTPHVSLYTGPGPVNRQKQARIAQAFTPFEGEVQGLAVSWVKGPEDYQVLLRASLGKP